MLVTSKVYRNLDAKFKVGGVEAPDLLAVLILAAILNLLLGRFTFGPIFIFGLPLSLLAALYFGKRGKAGQFPRSRTEVLHDPWSP